MNLVLLTLVPTLLAGACERFTPPILCVPLLGLVLLRVTTWSTKGDQTIRTRNVYFTIKAPRSTHLLRGAATIVYLACLLWALGCVQGLL